LPFEGAGAISTWQLDLPKWHTSLPRRFKALDHDTISDVILHFRYTARDGGDDLRDAAVTNLATAINQLAEVDQENQGLLRLFSVRHEFPDEWNAFRQSSGELEGQLTLRIGQERFPMLFRDETINVEKVFLMDGTETEPPDEGSEIATGSINKRSSLTWKISHAKDVDNILILCLYTIERETRQTRSNEHRPAIVNQEDRGDKTSAGFELFRDKAGSYRWRLNNNDDVIIAASVRGHENKAEAAAEIATVRRLAPAAHFKIQRDFVGQYRWQLHDEGGVIVTDSVRGFPRRADASREVKMVRELAPTARLNDLTGDVSAPL
jgi:uncharacterized protein YegP (UPF0339 family)